MNTDLTKQEQKEISGVMFKLSFLRKTRKSLKDAYGWASGAEHDGDTDIPCSWNDSLKGHISGALKHCGDVIDIKIEELETYFHL